jgi:hypothetical protein
MQWQDGECLGDAALGIACGNILYMIFFNANQTGLSSFFTVLPLNVREVVCFKCRHHRVPFKNEYGF